LWVWHDDTGNAASSHQWRQIHGTTQYSVPGPRDQAYAALKRRLLRKP
jgi:hypothetical protein